MVSLRYLRNFSGKISRECRGLSSTANGMLQLGISGPRTRYLRSTDEQEVISDLCTWQTIDIFLCSKPLPAFCGMILPSREKGPFVIGVAGASASGKTSVCNQLIRSLNHHRCLLMSMDWFYHGLPDDSAEEDYNFDHPDALDFQSIKEAMQLMLDKKPIEVPIYDYKMHKRLSRKRSLASADVVIIEGIFAFYYPEIRDLMNMKVFVDEDADTCLARRIRRDCSVRGRDIDSVLDQYEKFVKPSFDELIVPTKRFADIIVPRGRDNPVAIDLLRRHLQHKLDDSGSHSKLTVLKSSAQTEILAQAIVQARTD